MSKTRQPAGIPIGGQFATASRSRAHLSLVPDLPPEQLEAEEIHTPDPVTDTSPEPTQHSDTIRVTTDGQYTTVTGSKYSGDWRDVAEIAKDVRRDIKAAVADGTLPSQYSYSVTVDKYSMGQSMDITVKGMTFDEIHGLLRPDGLRNRRYTESTRDLLARLESFGRAYDKSTTDPMTSYHHGNHHTFAKVETPADAAWERADKARVANQRARREVAAALVPYAASARMRVSDLATADVTTDPRLTHLTNEERFAVLVEQEKLLAAATALAEAKQHFETLRDSENRWADDDLQDY